MSTPSKPLRGEAAWRASLAAIAKRNEAAQAAGVRRRAAKEAEDAHEAARLAHREAVELRSAPRH